MLKNTFVHIPRVGLRVERRLWQQGVLTWDDFLLDLRRMELSDALKESGLETIEESKVRLAKLDPAYFMKKLPRAETWRLYGDFGASCAFVDIETNGTLADDAITVIGVHDGKLYKPFVKYSNLLDAGDELFKYDMLATYNGTNFDLPMIYNLFPYLRNRHLHVDVMYPMRRLGYRGGLKKVEADMGILRSPETKHLTGWDAVKLWQEYERGKDMYLDTLLKYNCEDCKNLRPLAEFAYEKLKGEVFDRYARRRPA